MLILVAVFVLGSSPVQAAESYSNLFIKITDATLAVKKGDQASAKALVADLQAEFAQKANHDSKAGQEVTKSLAIKGEITEEKLTAITSKLLAFEKEQNPVDVEAEKQKLLTKLTPTYDKVQSAITAQDLEATKEAYKRMNSTWTINESIVRDTSTGHYGKIETAISFLRSSIETEPTDFTAIQTSFDDLKAAIESFVKGEEVAAASQNLTLKDGIDLLKQALESFQSGDKTKAASLMKEFITIWPTIEGDVSTRNPSLYTRVESESPVIMVRGVEADYQTKLQALISDLSAIDTTASYNFLDAALILLREGVEALLIVMALVSTLKASKQKKGLPWVYAGAGLGIFASLLIAYLLQTLFPAMTSSANREIIEGAVGLIAVIMMLVIGIWLHSKSSITKWNDFMEQQMRAVTATGSFVSMFALSFLAVFREGAETVLFYVGILPRITLQDFLLGIGLAIASLILLALVMIFATRKFKPYKIFFWLTWLIYALAFKMLGVSIHALQLTNLLPNHLVKGLPTLDWIGFYPSFESLLCQLVFVGVVIFVTLRNREQHG